MLIMKLVMGDDDKDCLVCRFPNSDHPTAGAPLPWPFCPVHYGEMLDDPKIKELIDLAEEAP